MAEKKDKTSQLNTFAKYSGIGIQMGVTIYIGKLLGEWLDLKFNNAEGTYAKVTIMIVTFLSLYLDNFLSSRKKKSSSFLLSF